MSDDRRPGEVLCTCLHAPKDQPEFSSGTTICSGRLMLLICDLQTLCLLFFFPSLPLTILSPLSPLVVCLFPFLSPNLFCFFYLLLPSLHPSAAVGVWDQYVFSYSPNTLNAFFCVTGESGLNGQLNVTSSLFISLRIASLAHGRSPSCTQDPF